MLLGDQALLIFNLFLASEFFIFKLNYFFKKNLILNMNVILFCYFDIKNRQK